MKSLTYFLLMVANLSAPDNKLVSNMTVDEPALAAFKKYCIHLEILDPREERYTLNSPDFFRSDLGLMRYRYHELADAPPLADCQRFPDRATVSGLLTFNRAYREQMAARAYVEPVHWPEYRAAVREADRLYEIWDMVRDVGTSSFYVTARRQALSDLRNAIGPEAYYAGRLPPHVPVRRFQRID